MASADRHYEPGQFTTFAAYEWTSAVDRGNLHRNVIFRGTDELPAPFSASDSPNPEDLWNYLDANRDAGIDAIAIPHNMNVSDGRMFALVDFAGMQGVVLDQVAVSVPGVDVLVDERAVVELYEANAALDQAPRQ